MIVEAVIFAIFNRNVGNAEIRIGGRIVWKRRYTTDELTGAIFRFVILRTGRGFSWGSPSSRSPSGQKLQLHDWLFFEFVAAGSCSRPGSLPSGRG